MNILWGVINRVLRGWKLFLIFAAFLAASFYRWRSGVHKEKADRAWEKIDRMKAKERIEDLQVMDKNRLKEKHKKELKKLRENPTGGLEGWID